MKRAYLPGIRKEGVYALVAILSVALVYFFTGLENQISSVIERKASELNGANVEIGNLQIKLFQRSIVLNKIQIAQHTSPMLNLLEIDRIALHFELTPLWRKKVVIDSVDIKGLQYGTQRQHSGSMDTTQLEWVPTSLLDRMSADIYRGVLGKLGENPLKSLELLTTGMDLSNRKKTDAPLEVSEVLKTILRQTDQTTLKWKPEIEQALNHLDDRHRNDWAKLKDIGNSPRQTRNSRAPAEINSLRHYWQEQSARLETLLQKQTQESDLILAQLKALSEPLQRDVRALRKRLNLPSTELSDLTASLLGNRLLDQFSRLHYYIDLSRRRMPKLTRTGGFPISAHYLSNATIVHYGHSQSTPMFILRQLTVESKHDPLRPRSIEASGELRYLTSDPSMLGYPTTLQIQADIASANLKNLNLTVMINHTGDHFHEEVTGSVDQFSLTGYRISNLNDLSLGFAQGIGSSTFHIKFLDEVIDATVDATFDQLEFAVNSRYKQIESILQDILQSIKHTTLKSSLKGPFTELSFNANSQMGKDLAKGLSRELHHQLVAVDSNLEKEILDSVEPQRLEILRLVEDRISDSRNTLKDSIRRSKDLNDLASQVRDRLSSVSSQPAQPLPSLN